MSAALDRFERRRHDAAGRVRREAQLEAAVAFLESAPLRRLRNGLVERTPLFELFLD